jgi:hypothetical protein
MNAGAKTLRRAKHAGFRIPLRTLRHFFATFAAFLCDLCGKAFDLVVRTKNHSPQSAGREPSMKGTLSPLFEKYDMTMVTNLGKGHS